MEIFVRRGLGLSYPWLKLLTPLPNTASPKKTPALGAGVFVSYCNQAALRAAGELEGVNQAEGGNRLVVTGAARAVGVITVAGKGTRALG